MSNSFLPPVNKSAANIPTYDTGQKPQQELILAEPTEMQAFDETVDQIIEKDFKTARKNLLDMLEKTELALDGIIRLAEMSDHPRAYEVVATMIKTLADVNKDLLELHNKKEDIKNKKPTAAQQAESIQNNQTNIMFNGTPAELQEFLSKGGKDG